HAIGVGLEQALQTLQLLLIVVHDQQATTRRLLQAGGNGHLVFVEESHKIAGANTPMSARRTERWDTSVFHPLVYRTRVHLQQRTNLVRRQQAVSTDFL